MGVSTALRRDLFSTSLHLTGSCAQSTRISQSCRLAGSTILRAKNETRFLAVRVVGTSDKSAAIFAALGGASTALYIGIVWLGTSVLHPPPLLMNVIAYLAVLPINFVLHRNFTFIAHSAVAGQVQRFLIVHSFNIMTSSLVYVVANLFNAPTLVAILGACIVVPACQFLALDLWVFRRKNRDALSINGPIIASQPDWRFPRRLNEPAEAAKFAKFRVSVESEYALICF